MGLMLSGIDRLAKAAGSLLQAHGKLGPMTVDSSKFSSLIERFPLEAPDKEQGCGLNAVLAAHRRGSFALGPDHEVSGQTDTCAPGGKFLRN